MKIIFFNGRARNERSRTIKFPFRKTCMAIGIFDGMHRGHRFLIKKMLDRARLLGAQPVVMTFFPHPADVLKPSVKMLYIASLNERLDWLKCLDVKVCIVVRFNRRFAQIEPEIFIKEILAKKLHAKAIFVGQDFHFGKDRRGDVVMFRKLAALYGYEMHAVAPLKDKKETISSTRIRQLIGEGDLDKAARFLGYPVVVSGRVVKGSGRGQELGFPTANIDYQRMPRVCFVLPPKGVYIVRVFLKDKAYGAVANIGTRPSFEQGFRVHLEVYIFNFSKNIYGQHLKVEFLKKIRDEKKFKSPQELVLQIQKDIHQARQYFSSHRAMIPGGH